MKNILATVYNIIITFIDIITIDITDFFCFFFVFLHRRHPAVLILTVK